jgi:hypothetical protein
MKEKEVERKEWERREGETARAYDGFREYRDMGASRSLAKAAEKLGKSTRLLKKWSRSHDWPARAHAYDEYMERKQQGVYETKLVEVNAAHLEMAKSARESVMVPLRALLKRIEKFREENFGEAAEVENIPIEKLLAIARPYVKLALDVVKMERLLYGLPTQTIKTEGTIGHSVNHDIKVVNEYIASLPDEELLRIVRNTKKHARNDRNGKHIPRGKGEG